MHRTTDTCVAIVLKKKGSDEFLIVRRPSDDPDLRGEWGLPAITLRPGELPEDGARRVCSEKLRCRGKPTKFLGTMFQRRNSYDLFLMDIEMELESGTKPNTTASNTKTTKYVEQKWTSDPLTLMPAAQNGSCCASIFLTDRGLLDRSHWVASLEGSDLVA